MGREKKQSSEQTESYCIYVEYYYKEALYSFENSTAPGIWFDLDLLKKNEWNKSFYNIPQEIFFSLTYSGFLDLAGCTGKETFTISFFIYLQLIAYISTPKNASVCVTH